MVNVGKYIIHGSYGYDWSWIYEIMWKPQVKIWTWVFVHPTHPPEVMCVKYWDIYIPKRGHLASTARPNAFYRIGKTSTSGLAWTCEHVCTSQDGDAPHLKSKHPRNCWFGVWNHWIFSQLILRHSQIEEDMCIFFKTSHSAYSCHMYLSVCGYLP